MTAAASQHQVAQRRPAWAVPAAAVVVALSVLAVIVDWPTDLAGSLRFTAEEVAKRPLALAWLIGAPTIIAAERIFAIEKPDYRDPDVVLSIIWHMVAGPLLAISVGYIVSWMPDVATDHLALTNITFFEDWNRWAIGAIAFLVADFMLYATHRLMHRVSWMWQIHEVHHAPKRMVMFVADRGHPFETVIRVVVFFVLFSLLGPGLFTAQWVGVIATFVTWWAMFTHANVRLGFGPLRYLLVTPQSHRIHHSARQDHWDSNYGFVLSVWDRLLGTQNSDHTSYPPTGIDRDDYPVPTSLHPKEMAAAMSAQLAWPVRRGR